MDHLSIWDSLESIKLENLLVVDEFLFAWRNKSKTDLNPDNPDNIVTKRTRICPPPLLSDSGLLYKILLNPLVRIAMSLDICV